jgi:hypothetical protein
MRLRVLVSLAVLTVAAQVLGAGPVRLVCKFTGRTMTGCACPPAEHPPAPTVGADGCCRLVATAAAQQPALRATPPSPAVDHGAPVALGLEVAPPAPRATRITLAARPPPLALALARSVRLLL